MANDVTTQDLLNRMVELEAKVIAAQQIAEAANRRATRADVRAAQLAVERLPALPEDAGHGRANGVSRLSRREALTKGALVGAAGLAAVVLTRPTQVEAAYSVQGDATNPAALATSLVAQPSYANGSYVFRADASPTNNATQAIDGLQGQGAGLANGVRAFGGQLDGAGLYSQGGGSHGPGLVAVGGQDSYGNAYHGEGVIAQGYGTTHGDAGGGGVGVRAFGGPGIRGGEGVIATGKGFAPGVIANGGSGSQTGLEAYAPFGAGGYFQGARAAIKLAAGPAAGPPTGFHQLGDIWADSGLTIWTCTAQGTPGTLVPLQQGGLNNALFTAVSTQQYTLANSDGATWVDVDGTNLKLTIAPGFNCQAILSANSDLWTSVAGYNQDLGISISGGAYPTVAGQPEAWKESGGFAGTFSPNAAFVETVIPLVAGTTYTIKLQWKANKNAPGATIWAGAGPIPVGSSTFSPTRLTAFLVVSQ